MGILAQDIWHNKLFNGTWQPAKASYTVIEVASGQSLGQIGYAAKEDVAVAALAAKTAQKQWAAASYQQRQAVMEAALKLLIEHQQEMIDWIIKESGSLRLKADAEIKGSIQQLKNCIGLVVSDQGNILPSNDGKISLAKRVPLGVVAVIAPFNFPLILALRAVAPALALGNAVILKPDERTTVCSGLAIARIFELAGLPQGLLHVLPGGADVGEALTLDPNIASIQFTGSTEVGRIVGSNAARTLKKVSLELGGKNALIILDDADVELAVQNIAWGAFLHSGQICMASGKILIQKGIYQQVKQRLIEKVQQFVVGNPLDPQVTIGPLINRRQVERVVSLVESAVQHGAVLEQGGQADGVFYHPTVLSDVQPDNPIFSQEIFGPVAVLVPFDLDDEAVELTNSGDYGLSAGIITANVGRAMRIAQQLNVGLLHINDQTVIDESFNPFGGFGASGNGTRIGGPANVEEFTQWQWMTIQAQAPNYPF